VRLIWCIHTVLIHFCAIAECHKDVLAIYDDMQRGFRGYRDLTSGPEANGRELMLNRYRAFIESFEPRIENIIRKTQRFPPRSSHAFMNTSFLPS